MIELSDETIFIKLKPLMFNCLKFVFELIITEKISMDFALIDPIFELFANFEL